MAMPKKGTRLVTVEGVAYRWRLSNHSALCVADREIIVELSINPSSTLVVKATEIDRDFGDDYHYEVTPALIETGIKKALSQGWHPDKRGTFNLKSSHSI
ncbi:MAG: hypothetical protein KDA52_05320 [Planctomycetaceae bacterium]|nr:hypothetical protein [Planctomycetaceae bacterium]